jgi:hypothetical protein
MGFGSWFSGVETAVGSAAGAVGGAIGAVGGAVAFPFVAVGSYVVGLFTQEEKVILDFFTPLIEQVKAQALILGKDDLAAGFKVLQDAAMGAVKAAENAPAGQKVATAEAEFLTILATEGLDAIHNAEAGLIKAAVAIIQTTPTPATGNTTPTSNT